MAQNSKYGSNVYVPKQARELLEKLVVEIGYKRGRIISASKFVAYLIETHGDQAKSALIKAERKNK